MSFQGDTARELLASGSEDHSLPTRTKHARPEPMPRGRSIAIFEEGEINRLMGSTVMAAILNGLTSPL